MSKAIGRDNIYRQITDKIIVKLERGIVPWAQPWTSGKQLFPLGLPVNGLTRRSYSGINILLLWSAIEDNGLPRWDEAPLPAPSPVAVGDTAAIARAISSSGLSVVQAGFDEDGRLVRLATTAGELGRPVRELADVVL
jgi:N-terminal domain of anti-restriction factor ArdC